MVDECSSSALCAFVSLCFCVQFFHHIFAHLNSECVFFSCKLNLKFSNKRKANIPRRVWCGTTQAENEYASRAPVFNLVNDCTLSKASASHSDMPLKWFGGSGPLKNFVERRIFYFLTKNFRKIWPHNVTKSYFISRFGSLRDFTQISKATVWCGVFSFTFWFRREY